MEDDSSRFGIEIEADFDYFFDSLENDDYQDADDDQARLMTAGDVGPLAEPERLDFGVDEPADPSIPAPTKEMRVDDRPPEEKLANLLESMSPQRHTIFGILRQCENPQPVASVNEYVADLQKYNASVFDAASICSLLEKAGGLALVTADGTPFDDAEAEPVSVLDEDGVECLQPGEPPEAYWMSTPEGMALAEAEEPAADLGSLLDKDAAYLHVYKHILKMASDEGGAAREAVFAAVDPVLAEIKPRRYSPYFVDKLFKCDALAWRGAWFITDLGARCLQQMGNVEDIGDEATRKDDPADQSR